MMLIAGHQQPVARDVEGTIGAFLVRQQPVPDHDVRTILEHRRQQLANVRGRIGAVSVDPCSVTPTAATLSHGSRRKTLILAAYEAPC